MGRDHEGGGLTEVESRCLTALIEFLDTTVVMRDRLPASHAKVQGAINSTSPNFATHS